MSYKPPFSVSEKAVRRVAEISAALERYLIRMEGENGLRLRKANRIRSICSSLAIEANTLTEEQVSAVLEGKRVIAPPNQILEVLNAKKAYELLPKLNPGSVEDLLSAHDVMMSGLIEETGKFRNSGVGVFSNEGVVHVAPPADRVSGLIADLLTWQKNSSAHELIKSAVFHYEFEFIHPFSDGNGRMGRLWQSLILGSWNPIFFHVPVENIVFKRQAEYYAAIAQSTESSDSSVFIDFMLDAILETLREPMDLSTPQVAPQVAPQVEQILNALGNQELTRGELMAVLHLSDVKNFRERYLKPALDAKLIEMTVPDKPNSRFQKYRKV